MDFEWNDQKRAQNQHKHNVDLLYAALIFDGPILTKQDNRKEYGEPRLISIGLVEDIPFVVARTLRGDTTRLISAWQGGRKDYDRYKDRIP